MWLFDSLAGLGGGLQVLNALIGSAVYFPLRYLLIRLSGASEAVCTIAAAVTALCPAYLATAGMWATDNACVPLFVLLVATAWWFFEAPSWRRAMALEWRPRASAGVYPRRRPGSAPGKRQVDPQQPMVRARPGRGWPSRFSSGAPEGNRASGGASDWPFLGESLERYPHRPPLPGGDGLLCRS